MFSGFAEFCHLDANSPDAERSLTAASRRRDVGGAERPSPGYPDAPGGQRHPADRLFAAAGALHAGCRTEQPSIPSVSATSGGRMSAAQPMAPGTLGDQSTRSSPSAPLAALGRAPRVSGAGRAMAASSGSGNSHRGPSAAGYAERMRPNPAGNARSSAVVA